MSPLGQLRRSARDEVIQRLLCPVRLLHGLGVGPARGAHGQAGIYHLPLDGFGRGTVQPRPLNRRHRALCGMEGGLGGVGLLARPRDLGRGHGLEAPRVGDPRREGLLVQLLPAAPGREHGRGIGPRGRLLIRGDAPGFGLLGRPQRLLSPRDGVLMLVCRWR